MFIVIYFSYLHMKTFYRTTIISTLIIHSLLLFICFVSILKGLKIASCCSTKCCGMIYNADWYSPFLCIQMNLRFKLLNIFSCFQYIACWLHRHSLQMRLCWKWIMLCLIVAGDNLRSANLWLFSTEGHAVVPHSPPVPDSSAALAVLFGNFYVFNIKYQAEALEFAQRCYRL